MKKESTALFQSPSAESTQKFGAALGRRLKKGDIVLLVAGLGAGKTTLVQGLANALGAAEEALSPTFVVAQTLNGRIPIHHLDFYRLSKKEILAAGVLDYLRGGGEIEKGLALIEWADRCKELWPAERLEIHMKIKKKTHSREITVRGVGPRYKKIVEALKK